MEKMLNYYEPKTRLISITKPVTDELKTPEELIAYTARVSNPGNQINNETASKLLSYCIRNAHWSIFEMVDATIEIECPRDIGRQILRQRTFTFQEFSQRYADPTKDLEFVIREARLQDPVNRQNSVEIENDPSVVENQKTIDMITEWRRRQHGIINQSRDLYAWAIENGIAKEQARAVLPEGLTMSRMYMNGTLRSWVH